jgi:branched-chain amino acid transport system substrate-binding protein
MTEAIKFTLSEQNFTAGKFHVAYQSCDDATAQAGAWDSAKCSANAAAYADNKAVVGVIGTFNSGCVKLIIPVLNRAPNGPIGIISPVNTYVGLTHSGPGTVAGEPDIYYPTGTQNFVRIVAADDYQGAADATFIKDTGVTNVYFLNDKDNYGFGVATNTRNALNALGGVTTAGFEAWDKNASSYEALARRIKDSGANGVFLGGTIDHNGGKLIKDLRAVLGSQVPIFTPDGFTPVSSIVSGAGAASEGVYLSIAGLPLSQLGPAGQAFVKKFGAQVGGTPQVYAAYAAQAAQIMMDAIAASDGTAGSVNANLRKASVKDGILGTFSLDAKGDTSANPVTIYQIRNGEQATVRVIVPPASLVKAS